VLLYLRVLRVRSRHASMSPGQGRWPRSGRQIRALQAARNRSTLMGGPVHDRPRRFGALAGRVRRAIPGIGARARRRLGTDRTTSAGSWSSSTHSPVDALHCRQRSAPDVARRSGSDLARAAGPDAQRSSATPTCSPIRPPRRRDIAHWRTNLANALDGLLAVGSPVRARTSWRPGSVSPECCGCRVCRRSRCHSARPPPVVVAFTTVESSLSAPELAVLFCWCSPANGCSRSTSRLAWRRSDGDAQCPAWTPGVPRRGRLTDDSLETRLWWRQREHSCPAHRRSGTGDNRST